jgi:hypothetical protein
MLACLSKRKRGAEMALHRGRMNLCARDRSLRSVFVCACLCVLICVQMMRSMHEMPVMMMILSVQMMRSIHDMLVMMKMGHFQGDVKGDVFVKGGVFRRSYPSFSFAPIA